MRPTRKSKRKKSTIVDLRGKEYEVVSKRLGKDRNGAQVHGLCSAPTEPDGTRTISVHSPLRGKKRMEILTHETIHGCCWDLDEVCVEELGMAIAEVLWQAGYRKSPLDRTLKMRQNSP